MPAVSMVALFQCVAIFINETASGALPFTLRLMRNRPVLSRDLIV